jgi:ABC-type transport system involved in Fe-S cluster assembly fused permease/ATPase subunit
MNASDTDANTKAIDSLLNFETVKYFGNEAMEARRFDGRHGGYERRPPRSGPRLAGSISARADLRRRHAGDDGMSALAVQAGEQTLGDFVFINAMLMQLSIPLNFIGFVYREIRQGLTDIEQMFDLLDVEPEVPTSPAPSRSSCAMAHHLRQRQIRYDPQRPILKGISLRGAGRQHGRHRRAVRRRQVDHLAAAVPFL